MKNKVKPLPAGYHSVIPSLVVHDAASAIEFYKTAFGAAEKMRMNGPEGKVVHAEMTIGDALFMVSDEFPEWGDLSPKSAGPSSVRIAIYVDDVDELFSRSFDAGATILIPATDQFYGDRSGRLQDPFGHIWIVSTHQEDVSPEEMQKRMDAFSKP